jgi:hypothetical protein
VGAGDGAGPHTPPDRHIHPQPGTAGNQYTGELS